MAYREDTGAGIRDNHAGKAARTVGYILALIQLILTVVFIVFMRFVPIIPDKYKLMISVALVLIVLIAVLMQRWLVSGIFGKIISVIMSVILAFGCIYVNATYSAIDKITGNTTKISTVGIYVLSADEMASLKDEEALASLASVNIGTPSNVGKESVSATIKHVSESGYTLTTSEYAGMIETAGALYSGEVRAMIIDESYITLLTETYPNFTVDTVVVYEYKVVDELTEGDGTGSASDNVMNTEAPASSGIYTFYFSGVDVYGSPAENRNSDVNILCVVNFNTQQILLLNTPRDFYVDTTVSLGSGLKDKLTHAGCAGVDCSVGTLEMLYGIDINYYFKINFTGFIDIIDKLGGVDVYSEYEFYADEYHYVQGYNSLDGAAALRFARERHSFPSGDIQRGKNQMAVIQAMIKKMASTDMVLNYTSVVAAISDSMVTNMSSEEMGEFVGKVDMGSLGGWSVSSFTVGGAGDTLCTYSMPNSPNYVMIPDENLMNMAKAYLTSMYSNETITVQ